MEKGIKSQQRERTWHLSGSTSTSLAAQVLLTASPSFHSLRDVCALRSIVQRHIYVKVYTCSLWRCRLSRAEGAGFGPADAQTSPSSKLGGLDRSPTPPGFLAVRENGFEDGGIMPVVEPEYELVEVSLKVLCRHAMVDADDRSLEERPERFDAHNVDVAVHECLGVVDLHMGITNSGLGVASEFVGAEEFGVGADECMKERGKRFGLEVRDDLSGHGSTSLLEPDNGCLAKSATATDSSPDATNVGVVNLDDPGEFVFEPIPWPHGLTDLHRHAPSGLVRYPDGAFDLLGRYALLAFDHQPDGDEPLTKRGSRAVEDRSGGHGELVGASGALPQVAILQPVGMVGSALGARNAIGPAHSAQEGLALVLGGELLLKLDDVHDSSLRDYHSTIGGLSQGDKALFHFALSVGGDYD